MYLDTFFVLVFMKLASADRPNLVAEFPVKDEAACMNVTYNQLKAYAGRDAYWLENEEHAAKKKLGYTVLVTCKVVREWVEGG